MHYLPNEARQEAEAAVAAAREEAAQRQARAEELAGSCEAAERRAREAEAEAALTVRTAEERFAGRALAYEERIRELERLLEEERREHAADLQARLAQAQETQKAANTRVGQIQESCTAAVAAAEKRAREAQRNLEDVQQRSEERLSAAKAHSAARIEELRREAAEQLRVSEGLKRDAFDEFRKACFKQGLDLKAKQQIQQALDEAARRVRSNESEIYAWRTAKESQLAERERELEARNRRRLAQQRDVEAHHQGLLGLEQGLHAQTMDRTLNRITRQLQFGDATDAGGRDTPTRELLANALAPST